MRGARFKEGKVDPTPGEHGSRPLPLNRRQDHLRLEFHAVSPVLSHPGRSSYLTSAQLS